jgi:hypothetical protein
MFLTAAGAMAMVPFLVCLASFRKLFWFGDEWDQIDQIQSEGLWHWTWAVFAENFVPLFKLLWAAAIFAGHGSYLFLLTALWLTHALNVFLFAFVLHRSGIRAPAAAPALALAALPATNVETLGWSIQWSPILAFTSFLAAALALVTLAQRGPSRGTVAGLFLGSLLSALCFSRGVLSGTSLAFVCATSSFGKRWTAAAASLAPALAVAAVIASQTQGNHRQLDAAAIFAAAQFGLRFFLCNPIQPLLAMPVWLAGAIKIAAFIAALRLARGTERTLVSLFVVLDLSNAALVGLGRYHTGLAAAIASRYQYAPLFCVAVALAIVAQRLLERGRRPGLTLLAGSAVVIAVAVAWPWRSALRTWSEWRGMEIRRALHDNPPDSSIPYAPGLSISRCRALAARLNLH